MTFPLNENNGQLAKARRQSARAMATLVAGVAGVSMAGLVGLAAAASPATLATAANSTLAKTIVVNSHGITVYELRPESSHHLLCTKKNGCFSIWKPVTASSKKAKLAATGGITSKLGLVHRNGLFQVTLGGHPLYTFVGDHSQIGSATGQGLHSFHGTWHVVATASAPAAPTTPTVPTTPTTPTMPTTPTTPTTPYYPPIWL